MSNHSKGNASREDAIPNIGKVLDPDLQRIVSIFACDIRTSNILTREKSAGYRNDRSKQSLGT